MIFFSCGVYKGPCLEDTISMLNVGWTFPMILRGVVGEFSVTLIINYFFILLHKFNLHNLIYNYLKFQTRITDDQSFIMTYVNKFLRLLSALLGIVSQPIYLNFHFLNISTYSKCKGFHNFQAIKLKFFLHVPHCMVNKSRY